MNSLILQKNNQGRIEWIDALKGLTIILVVFSHVELKGMGLQNSVVNSFFILFRMPLFFFMSGFLAYHAGFVWNESNIRALLLKKTRIQLVPTAFWGLINCAIIKGDGRVNSLIFNMFHNGYWFTLVLMEMFMIYFFVSWLSNKCLGKKDGLVALGILAVIVSYLSDDGGIVYNAFSFSQLCAYLQFFVFGLLCRKHGCILDCIIKNKYLMAALILLWFASVYFALFDFGTTMISTVFQNTFKLLAGYLGIGVLVSFFYLYQNLFSHSTVKGRYLQ